ncbi:DUF397 domain-containing protein [Streptomyces sp. SID11385]|uniref:DUF397 domain-containing protein n=1 Tax=Streptomyces sp. SID11385 TaxID=2706031 RepID=UPI0013C84920|nr:DUF397 domain-containing protein [Streptomyces sp. SID11385]NEA40207.1 DUF397 domain-containing protein [Streptomyces sp. SID11385]
MEAQPLHWLRSSYSGQGGDCVEVAANVAPLTGTVPLRDSKRPEGDVIAFGARAFVAFLGAVRQG